MEGIKLNSNNSKSAVNPYFQTKLPESAPTHIRNNLARRRGSHKVSNQHAMVSIFGFRRSGLFRFFCQSEEKSEKRSIHTANSLDLLNTKNKARWRVFLDYLQPFTLCWKKLLKKTETRENIMKMNDLLVFITLEKYKKTHGNVAVRTDANMKKLDAIYRLN